MILRRDIASRYWVTVLSHGIASWYCDMVLRHGTASRYCGTLLRHSIASWYWVMVLRHGIASLYSGTRAQRDLPPPPPIRFQRVAPRPNFSCQSLDQHIIFLFQKLQSCSWIDNMCMYVCLSISLSLSLWDSASETRKIVMCKHHIMQIFLQAFLNNYWKNWKQQSFSLGKLAHHGKHITVRSTNDMYLHTEK